MMDNRNSGRSGNASGPARPSQTFFLWCTLFFMAIFLTQPAFAKPPVSGRYTSTSGDTIRLRLSIGSPSPQNLILEQYLPPGTRILSASPPLKQTNSSSGVAKWLFKGVSPGNIDVTLRVSPASSVRKVSGILRYRMPGGGGMNELRISP